MPRSPPAALRKSAPICQREGLVHGLLIGAAIIGQAQWIGVRRRADPRPKASSPLIAIPTAPSVPSCSELSRYGLARAEHAAGMQPMGGCLCIGCLEKRLKRPLKPKDFARSHEFNNPGIPGTPLLLKRRIDR